MDQISALPNSRDSIVVTWLCPEFNNTQDHAFLRYTVFYQPGFTVDIDSADSVDEQLPTLQNGTESSECLSEANVTGLAVGTTYAVKVVAVSPEGMRGDVADAFAVTTTFGNGEL